MMEMKKFENLYALGEREREFDYDRFPVDNESLGLADGIFRPRLKGILWREIQETEGVESPTRKLRVAHIRREAIDRHCLRVFRRPSGWKRPVEADDQVPRTPCWINRADSHWCRRASRLLFCSNRHAR